MVHAFFRLAAARPQLLAEHVSAYSDLFAEELSATAVLLKLRLGYQLAAAACLAVAAVLAGVALMLWASLPAGSLGAPWALLLTPAVPALLGVGAILKAGAADPGPWFATLRLQLAADAALLRGAGEP